MENIESMLSIEEKGQCYAADYADSDIYTESIGDYILPDYQPEIRKILLVTSSLLPSGNYESGGRATFGGSVRHHILYSDGEGNLQSVELFSDYDYAFDAGEAATGTALHAKERITGVNCRLSGPRKLSIRTKILSHVYMIGKKSAACDITGTAKAPECLTVSEMLPARRFVSTESELSCDVALPFEEGEYTVKRADATLHVREVRAEHGDVYMRGDAYVTLIIGSEDGTVLPLTARTAFEEVYNGGEIAADATLLGYALVGGVTAVVGEGDGGKTVTVTVPVTLTAEIIETKETLFTVDAYSGDNEICLTEETAKLPILHFGGMGHFSVTAAARMAELDATDAESVLGATVTAEEVVCRFDGMRATVNGNARVRLLYTAADEGKTRYASAEYCVPFRGEITFPGEPLRYRVDGGFCDIRTRIDGDSFAVDAEYVFALTAENEKELTGIREIRDGTPIPSPEMAAIVIAYPETGDSLWDVGKRYRVPLSVLGEVNRLDTRAVSAPASPSSLDGVSRLVIVK